MEPTYKIIRTLKDGQRAPVASFNDLNEARQTIASLSRYWPGHYSILCSPSDELVVERKDKGKRPGGQDKNLPQVVTEREVSNDENKTSS